MILTLVNGTSLTNLLLRRRRMKYDVFLVNFGYTASAGHKTLAEAIKAAKKTGFQCNIFERDDKSTGPYDPIGKLVQWVSPI